MNRRAAGDRGEDAAARHYAGLGYRIVARNWYFRRIGEIDLILEKNTACCRCAGPTYSENAEGAENIQIYCDRDEKYADKECAGKRYVEGLLVFAEVKLRRDMSFAPASAAINRKKQTTVRKLAAAFIAMHSEFSGYSVRFDAVEVYPKNASAFLYYKRGAEAEGFNGSGLFSVNVIEGAF